MRRRHREPPDPVQLALDRAVDLAEHHATIIVDGQERVRPIYFAHEDAHGIGIPVGVTQGSVVAYAQALLERSWPGVMRAMIMAEIDKEAA